MNYPISAALILAVTQTVSTGPIQLGYNPNIRPFYAPKPFRYPEPIIRPGTTTHEITSSSYPESSHYPTNLPNQQSSNQHFPNRHGEPLATSIGVTANYETTRPLYTSRPAETDEDYPSFEEFVSSFTNNELSSTFIPSSSNIGDKFGETTHAQSVLDYSPTRPFYAGSPKPYPEPITRPKPAVSYSLDDRFKETTLPATMESSNVPNLSYVPSRPPFAGSPQEYPQPIGSNPPNFAGDRFGETTHAQSVLDYTPTRPFYAGSPKPYPEPITRPTPEMPTHPVDDKFGQTTGFSNVPNLNHEPTRPPFAGRPQEYPRPSESYPSSQSIDLDNRNKVTSTTTALAPSSIVLGYRPTRPFYAGNYKPYPEPIIRPNPETDNVNRFGETTLAAVTTTQKPETTTNYYENFVYNLQLLLEYVQKLQNSTTTPSSGDASIPEVTPSSLDINKIAEVIKPLFTTVAPAKVD